MRISLFFLIILGCFYVKDSSIVLIEYQLWDVLLLSLWNAIVFMITGKTTFPHLMHMSEYARQAQYIFILSCFSLGLFSKEWIGANKQLWKAWIESQKLLYKHCIFSESKGYFKQLVKSLMFILVFPFISTLHVLLSFWVLIHIIIPTWAGEYLTRIVRTFKASN